MTKDMKVLLGNYDRLQIIFGVTFPVRKEEFVEIYNAMPESEERTPYLSADMFAVIYEAFLMILDSSSPYFLSDVAPRTTMGVPLSELGNGVGQKNTVTCIDCNANGFTKKKLSFWEPCTACDAKGKIPHVVTCPDCNGTKQFKQKNTGSIVPCRRCSATGNILHPKQTVVCKSCKGEKGKVITIKKLKVFYICNKCKGTGAKRRQTKYVSRFGKQLKKVQQESRGASA